MTAIIAILLITLIVMVWVAWGRAWLHSKREVWPWANKFFQAIEPVEIKLWGKSETLMWARFKMLIGIVMTTLVQLQQIDLGPIKPFLPEKYKAWLEVAVDFTPLTLTVLGYIDEQLRKGTTQPLELVAVSEKEMAEQPIIREAVETANTVKLEAVAAVVEEQKASVDVI